MQVTTALETAQGQDQIHVAPTAVKSISLATEAVKLTKPQSKQKRTNKGTTTTMGERTAESRAMSVEVSAVVLMGVGELELGTESAVESAVESAEELAAGAEAEAAVEAEVEAMAEAAVGALEEAAAEVAAETVVGLSVMLRMLQAADLVSVSAAESVAPLEGIRLPM